ncbi:MAG: DUF3617 family protein [Pseudomonadota bacterium]
MRICRLALPFVLATASAAAAEGLRPGLYDVEVRIEIPHIDTSDYDFTRQICLADASEDLGPMGPGPLAQCPGEVRASGKWLDVTTTCPGPNAGTALARYRETPRGFKGVVSLNMGGKNMTLAERQTGTWLGPC